jgi:hypothetical protein
MNQTVSKKRILAISPSARGFGYCTTEGGRILEWGYKGVEGDKNLHSIAKIRRLMKQCLPDVLVLQDVNAKVKGCRRSRRIKALHRKIIKLATAQKCEVSLMSGQSLRNSITGSVKGTKQQMAESLAKKFPELAAKLPPKRRAWDSENGRMDLFDAVGLATAFYPPVV